MNDDRLSPMAGLDSLREQQVQAWQRGERLLVESLISNSNSQLSQKEMLELNLRRSHCGENAAKPLIQKKRLYHDENDDEC